MASHGYSFGFEESWHLEIPAAEETPLRPAKWPTRKLWKHNGCLRLAKTLMKKKPTTNILHLESSGFWNSKMVRRLTEAAKKWRRLKKRRNSAWEAYALLRKYKHTTGYKLQWLSESENEETTGSNAQKLATCYRLAKASVWSRLAKATVFNDCKSPQYQAICRKLRLSLSVLSKIHD